MDGTQENPLSVMRKSQQIMNRNNTGHEIHLDNKSASPQPQGASPMELLLMGIAGCSSIDIVAILNKQKSVFLKFLYKPCFFEASAAIDAV